MNPNDPKLSTEFFELHFETLLRLTRCLPHLPEVEIKSLLKAVANANRHSDNYLDLSNILQVKNVTDYYHQWSSDKRPRHLRIVGDDGGLLAMNLFLYHDSLVSKVTQVVDRREDCRFYDGFNFEQMKNNWRYKSVLTLAPNQSPLGFDNLAAERFSDNELVPLSLDYDCCIIFGNIDFFVTKKEKLKLLPSRPYIVSCLNQGWHAQDDKFQKTLARLFSDHRCENTVHQLVGDAEQILFSIAPKTAPF